MAATTTSSVLETAHSTTQAQWDDLAQALQFSVAVQDRKCKKTRKKFHKVFVGSDAVDILMQLAQVSTRLEALEIGRQLQSHYAGMFECVNSPKVVRLEDDKRLLYRFGMSMTSSTRGRHEALMANLEEKMRLFQRSVQVQDRTLRLTTYKQCFVGKEAVDVMMRLKLASSRRDCVELGRILRRNYNLFLPMTGDHDFEDE
jgi:hypothetical protein